MSQNYQGHLSTYPIGIQYASTSMGVVRDFVREYASAEWTGVEKRSHHLVLWSRNHVYSALMWKD